MTCMSKNKLVLVYMFVWWYHNPLWIVFRSVRRSSSDHFIEGTFRSWVRLFYHLFKRIDTAFDFKGEFAVRLRLDEDFFESYI